MTCACGCGEPVQGTRHGRPTRFVRGHNGTLTTDQRLFRFMPKVQKTDGCWNWVGACGPGGYGKYAGTVAHRVAYELMVGPIPEGLTLDHLCRNPRCVNPAHLEPVTLLVNIRRGSEAQQTSCVHGHPFDEGNTYFDASGHRNCRACNRESARRLRSRKAVRP